MRREASRWGDLEAMRNRRQPAGGETWEIRDGRWNLLNVLSSYLENPIIPAVIPPVGATYSLSVSRTRAPWLTPRDHPALPRFSPSFLNKSKSG